MSNLHTHYRFKLEFQRWTNIQVVGFYLYPALTMGQVPIKIMIESVDTSNKTVCILYRKYFCNTSLLFATKYSFFYKESFPSSLKLSICLSGIMLAVKKSDPPIAFIIPMGSVSNMKKNVLQQHCERIYYFSFHTQFISEPFVGLRRDNLCVCVFPKSYVSFTWLSDSHQSIISFCISLT